MNSTWLIAPSSRLRLAMRNAARAASARASAVASESALVLSRSSDCWTSSCTCCVSSSSCVAVLRAVADAWRTAARRAPPSKNVQLSSSDTVA